MKVGAEGGGHHAGLKNMLNIINFKNIYFVKKGVKNYIFQNIFYIKERCGKRSCLLGKVLKHFYLLRKGAENAVVC